MVKTQDGMDPRPAGSAGEKRVPAIVVDIAKKRKPKQIKQLRRGEGKLMAEVEALIARLVADKTIEEGAQPVVLVVRERPKRKDWWA
jgi:hypothetical protein